MKGFSILTVGVMMLAASCVPHTPVSTPVKTTPTVNTGAAAVQPANTLGNVLRNRQYLALPGQSPVAVSNDTDAAFEQQAAAYAAQTGGAAAPVAAQPMPQAAPGVYMPQTPAPAAQMPAAAAPAVGNMGAFQAAAATAVSSVFPAAGGVQPAAAAPTAQPELMDYTVKITNGTPNRLFIEAQDASGTIYPCGFMHENRSYSTPMVQAAPIHGPITVVVRDPDQPDAPELRRYKVNPPPFNYAGRTISIKILPGGYYQAMVDGVVYYISPAPEGKPNKPAVAPAPAAPAPAAEAKPAEQPKPAPAPTPAPVPAPAPTPAPAPAAA